MRIVGKATAKEGAQGSLQGGKEESRPFGCFFSWSDDIYHQLVANLRVSLQELLFVAEEEKGFQLGG